MGGTHNFHPGTASNCNETADSFTTSPFSNNTLISDQTAALQAQIQNSKPKTPLNVAAFGSSSNGGLQYTLQSSRTNAKSKIA